MKKFPMFLFLVLAIGFASCSKDDEGDKDTNHDPGYNFEEQTLQGIIDGNDYIIRDGVVKEDPYDSTLYRFDLLDTAQDSIDLCEFFSFGHGDRVMFTIPLKEGLHILGYGDDKHKVTLFGKEDTVYNVTGTGAIEITGVEVTDSITTVSGRMDVRYDDENHVNGEFESIKVCQ